MAVSHWWAESDQPIYQDFNRMKACAAPGFSADDDAMLTHERSDRPAGEAGRRRASCLNLYQARRPSVLGVPKAMIERGGFAWAASAAKSRDELENPWRLLEKPLPADADGVRPIPVILEQNTAMYAVAPLERRGRELRDV